VASDDKAGGAQTCKDLRVSIKVQEQLIAKQEAVLSTLKLCRDLLLAELQQAESEKKVR
jgi:hypothetical protein